MVAARPRGFRRKMASQAAILMMGATLFATPVPAIAQLPADADAQVLTVFDRQGYVTTTVGEPGSYRDPVFSPDRTRLAVIREDPESETMDLWVFDIATGAATRITSDATVGQERVGTPVWSPDGSELAYMVLRGGYERVYRRSSQGERPEEFLYEYPGAGMRLWDWSTDGRFVIFSSTGISGGRVYALPMDGEGERTAIPLLSSESQLRGSSVSLDGRFLSYTSDRSGRDEVYVQPFDPSAGGGAAPVAQSSQVSDRGGEALVSGWRADGGEIYYVAADRGLMAVEVTTGSTLGFGQPTLLFRLSEAVDVTPATANVSRDGDRIVIALPRTPILQQITIFGRQGTIVREVGEPGRYRNPSLSPDGTRVAVHRIVPDTRDREIWTFDIDSGAGRPVVSDDFWQETPLWSPDGNELAYASVHGLFDGIYQKAADGSGDPEQWFQYTPGADLELTDWSADGRFIAFHDGCWGVLYVLPVGEGEEGLEQEAIEWLRDAYHVAQARFSPDSRFIAYLSDEIEPDVFEVYVGPFDASEPDGGGGRAMPVQVSTGGAWGRVSWRQDGRELYYVTREWEIMAVEVTTTPTFQAGAPRRLFTLPGPLSGNPAVGANVSPDGQRFVFAINLPVTAN